MYCLVEWTNAVGDRCKRGRPNFTKKLCADMIRQLEEEGGHSFEVRWSLRGFRVWP